MHADDGGAFSIYLVGTGLDGLTDDNFSGTNLTISEYDSETHNVVGTLNGAASTTLIVTVDETTIATIGISPYQDDNGHPIDTGD